MELQRLLPEFEALGVALFVVSSDSPEVLSRFAEHYGITYSLLSDQDSAVIREYGILNTLVDPDEDVYGIPFPGVYAVGEDGRVQEKLFHRLYQERDSAPRLLRLAYGYAPHPEGTPAASASSKDVTVSAVLSTPDLRFKQLTELYVTLSMPEGLHVNGRPLPEGYIPTTVTVVAPDNIEVSEPEYPPAEPFTVAGLSERLNVYSGEARIVVPLRLDVRETGAVTLEVQVRYQACNEEECFLPVTQELRLEVALAENAAGIPRPD